MPTSTSSPVGGTAVNVVWFEVFAGSDEWYEFDATLDCQVLLDGHATFDILRAPDRDLEGITLRL